MNSVALEDITRTQDGSDKKGLIDRIEWILSGGCLAARAAIYQEPNPICEWFQKDAVLPHIVCGEAWPKDGI